MSNQKYFFKLGVLIISFLVLFVMFWSVDKGMIFSDEAFYIFHHDPDLHKIRFSNWHVLYSPLIFANFIFTKYVLLGIMCFSAFLLGYNSSRYFKIPLAYIVGLLSLMAQFVLIYPIGYTPSYSTLNSIAINFGIAFFMRYLIHGNANWLFLCGFFLAYLPLLMIPNAAIALPFLTLLYLSSEKGNFPKAFLKLVGGVLILYLLYFVFLDSPQNFYDKLIEAIDYLGYIDTHGGSPMIEWHIEIVRNFIAGLSVLLLLFISKKYSQLRIFSFSVMLIILLFYTYRSVFNYDAHFYSTPYYLLILFLFFLYFKKETKQGCYVLAFFILTPYFVSLGTEVNFFVRSSMYFSFLFIAGIVLVQHSSKSIKWIYLCLFSISILNFFTFPFRENWERYRLIDQKILTKLNGAKYYLDEERFENLQKLKPYLENEKYVLVSHQSLWGYVLNSNATPPLVHFQPNLYVVKYIKEKNIPIEELVLLELKNRPFEKEFLDSLVETNRKLQPKVKLDEFIIYSID